MNVNEIELALSQKITSSSSNLDVLVATKVLSYLKTNGIFTASSYGGLPAAASNEGKIYFIEDIETVVWSNGTDWLKLLDKNTIQSQLWSWGRNRCGALGDGTTTDRCSPVREISSSTDWCYVSGGCESPMAIKTSGELWGWGVNFCGILGDGTTTYRCSPVREISCSTDWCYVNSAGNSTAAIKTSGQLWAWGGGSCGLLGTGTLTSACSPVREFCSATDWCQVSVSFRATAAIKTSGQLWTWGSNGYAMLGDGTTTDRCSPVRERCSATDWCQVSATNTHTTAIKTSGQLWTWGNNTCGKLGDGTTTTRCSPVREKSSSTNWCQVSAGASHTAAIKTSGQLWTWGNGNCGRLGTGTLTSACSPVRERCSATDWCGVSATSTHTTAIKTSSEIWSWGSNFCGRLGDGTTTDRCSPVREISSSTDWRQVSAGVNSTFAIKLV